ncbi:ribosome-binding factor A [Chryseotalea sanaruensis]|uniref:Ribosome-binding factor A n=1 Tax=Chryseotalea sanaruensis TaxID=2482724 RepID=A0A401U8D1_9BACT|nr:30S ribosome-binding factor RbfA [Chryseotalea sanaruensis]GCC51152.1 ribosome-binding factor A [Chryseotalea sanaruensis]
MSIAVTCSPMTGSTRQQRVAKLIQKEMSDIFQRDRRGLLDNAFLSIAEVRVSPDLSVAKLYISMMLVKDKQALLAKINDHKKEFRKLLGDKVGKQLRIVPEIVFYVDEVEENAQKLDDIINNLNIPPTE